MSKNKNLEKINNSNKKERVVVWLTADAIECGEKLISLNGIKNMSQTIEQALLFYAGYVMTNENTDFLAESISNVVEARITQTENRLSKILFKEAVELSKLVHMLSSLNDLDDATLERLHLYAVKEVREINGAIRLENSVKYHREN